jgi:putative spermidine/putrescine transport system substrate-binding protein
LLWIVPVFLLIGTFIAGCAASGEPKETEQDQTARGNLLEAGWDEILSEAEGQTVNMYMWGGSTTNNRYIDEWVAPRLKESTGVTLRRVPINDTKDIINQLLAEKRAGKKNGSADIIWINGENFKAAKDNGLIWGSFAEKLPNFQRYINQDDPNVKYDFGEAINGLEAPWGKAQFVFIYDSDKIKKPPKSMAELKSWVKANPGRFTYPAPPDFTGSAFVRQAMYETTGGHQQYLNPMTADDLAAKLTPLWDYLNEIKPYLWRQGQTYPESLAKLDQLYTSGEVWLTMGYDPARATNEIKNGNFPESSRTFVLDGGTLSNFHYLSIPFNAEHPAGAMVAINFMESPDAQIAKSDPAIWGEEMALDPNQLPAEAKQRLSEIDRGVATLPADELAAHQLPEIPAANVDLIEQGWTEHVAKK